MNSQVDCSLAALQMRGTYPCIKKPLVEGLVVFNHGDYRRDFVPAIKEWMEVCEVQVYSDFFVYVLSDTVEFYFRNSDLAAEFKLRFL